MISSSVHCNSVSVTASVLLPLKVYSTYYWGAVLCIEEPDIRILRFMSESVIIMMNKHCQFE